eukprot:364900-Chlamydomonas_euryale.AAC.5
MQRGTKHEYGRTEVWTLGCGSHLAPPQHAQCAASAATAAMTRKSADDSPQQRRQRAAIIAGSGGCSCGCRRGAATVTAAGCGRRCSALANELEKLVARR